MENEVNDVVNSTNQDVDYKALYESTKSDLEAKTGKVDELEGLIQKHKDKKTPKVEYNETQGDSKELFTKMLDERDFFAANPTMSEHKEAIDKFTSTGLSHNDAMTLVMANDSTIAARQNTNNSNFSGGSSGGGKKTYTQEQLQKLAPAEKMQALKEIYELGTATETL